jgi:hypothetical protein
MIKYYLQNWKLGIHLLFKTYRFGVNNEWWCNYDSMFGEPFYKRFNILQSYRQLRFRAEIGFIDEQTFKLLFPIYSKHK